MIYIQDRNNINKLVAVIDNEDYRDGGYTQGLDGENSLWFKIDMSHRSAEHLSEGCRLIRRNRRGFWQEYVAWKVHHFSGGTIAVKAVGAEQEIDILKIMHAGKYEAATLAEMAGIVVAGTGYQLGRVDFASYQTETIENAVGGYAFLKRLGSYFERELLFYVEISGTKILGRYVDLVERIGRNNPATIRYGDNLIELEREIDIDGLVTLLECRGPEREDGTRLTAEVADEDAYNRWHIDRKHRRKYYEPSSTDGEMTQDRLEQLGRTELNKRIARAVTYRLSAAVFPGDDYALGDTIKVEDTSFNPPLYAESRIIKESGPIEYVPEDVTDIQLEFGEIEEFDIEDLRADFKRLQELYSIKIIRQAEKPTPQRRAIWVKEKVETESLGIASIEVPSFEISHIANEELTDWIPMTASSAEEIGGLMVGQQYNGVSVTHEEGLIVNRTDELVRAVINATEGISMQARSDLTEAFKKVFFVDEAGNLNMVGIMYGSSIILGGEDSGSLTILGEDGAPIAQLDENVRDMPDLTVGYLDAPNKVEYVDFGDTPFIQCVAAETMSGVAEPSDGNTGENWGSPLQTVSEALRRLPRMFDGIAEIHLAYGQTYNEEVFISGFTGRGTLIIRNSADTTRATVSGKAEITNNSIFVEWRDLNLNSTDPYAGFFLRGSVGKLVNCRVNGASGDTTFGINANSGAFFELYNCSYFNCVTAVRASYGGNAYMSDNTGEVSGTAIQAFGGGMVSGQGTAPTGGAGNTSEIAGGQVTGTWNFPTPPSAPAPVTKTTKDTFNSLTSASGTWRADENKWDSTSYYGSYATQGSYYGYGPFTGAWFFGALPTGKKIKSMRLYVSRKAGGVNAKVNVSFRPHTNAFRPSGNVSMQSTWHSVGIAVGESKWISLPSKFFAGFESGSYKGMAIGGSAYAKLGVSAKLEITYEEVA